MKNDGYLTEVPRRSGGPPATRVGKRGCSLITELAARGCALGTIARALRITTQQLTACRKAQPEVGTAFVHGEAALHDSLFAVLRDAAVDTSNPKHVIAAMFLLKARFGYRDQGPTDGNDAGVTVNINLPASVPLEKFLESTGGVQVTSGDGTTKTLERA